MKSGLEIIPVARMDEVLQARAGAHARAHRVGRGGRGGRRCRPRRRPRWRGRHRPGPLKARRRELKPGRESDLPPFSVKPLPHLRRALAKPPESPPLGWVGTAYEAGSLRWRRDRLAAHSRRSKTFAPRALRNRAGFSLLLGLRGEAPGAKTQAATGGRLAQLVERFVYTEDVGSSSLSSPTMSPDGPHSASAL